MLRYGLIGHQISYSFSPAYFANKFKKLGILASYELFDMPDLTGLQTIITKNNLQGFNVTVPFKEAIIAHTTTISEQAKAIGAVNTVVFNQNRLHGYNTDYLGFQASIKPLLKKHHKQALVFGTGGASKAVIFALQQLDITAHVVSRNGALTYSELPDALIAESHIIVNCTPVGTSSKTDKLAFNYELLNAKHLVYDLVYNPTKTALLQVAEKQGATIKNGQEMLELQAEESWKIWQKFR